MHMCLRIDMKCTKSNRANGILDFSYGNNEQQLTQSNKNNGIETLLYSKGPLCYLFFSFYS